MTGVAEYHIDADEPSVLDYNTDFKSANLQATLYAPDQFRISDHDPVIVGLSPIAPPTITGFTPTQGAIGTVVTITGTRFTGATSVTIGGRAATFTVVSATQIRATVPVGVTSGRIVVTTGGGSATSAAVFTVSLAPAGITFSPASGRVGSTVTISGTGLNYARTVTIGGRSALFRVASPTALIATVPAGAVTGKIVVTSPYGSATSANSFYVLP